MYASLRAVLKIIAHSSFAVWRLCCLGLPFSKKWGDPCPKQKKSRGTISIHFGFLLASPALVLPCGNSSFGGSSTWFWLREWVGAAPSEAAADSPSWITHQRCCCSAHRSDAVSRAAFISASFQPVFLGLAQPEWHRQLGGLGNCCSSQQRGSTRAVTSLYHQHPPTSSPVK